MYQITEGSETYDIDPSDFVKVVAVRPGFVQEHGELIAQDQEVNLPGSVFANGKPAWLKVLGVFGGKKVESVEIDTSKKKAPNKKAASE